VKQFYQDFKFHQSTLKLIETMNTIVADYMAQGFVLTVRQLYYQLVARDIIPNTEKSYKRITGTVNDARLAGLMDWDGIEDRTRAFIRRPSWDSGRSILESAANSFHMDMWETQESRVFVIVEKEALAGVLEGVCREYDMPLLAARGYPSGTVLRDFARSDIIPALRANQKPLILHLGDHDPSGIDMTRDLAERLSMFAQNEYDWEIRRIALNMDQIQEYNPPPNPAKSTDARFQGYMDRFGNESWELDALEPKTLIDLVTQHVEEVIDHGEWEDRKDEIGVTKQRILEVAEDF
jgi:hypothetical protein